MHRLLLYSRRIWLELQNRCPVHGCFLQLDTVPVRYGLVRLSERYRAARFDLFPVAKSEVLGGCVVGSQKTALVRFCQSCRDAEQAWADANPTNWSDFLDDPDR